MPPQSCAEKSLTLNPLTIERAGKLQLCAGEYLVSLLEFCCAYTDLKLMYTKDSSLWQGSGLRVRSKIG